MLARTDRAKSDARKAHATSDLARIGARYDLGEPALAEATGLPGSWQPATRAKTAKTWLAAVLQAQSIGAAEPRDLADAFLNFFQNRAQFGAAAFQVEMRGGPTRAKG